MMWFVLTLYLIGLSWMLSGVGNHYVRVSQRLVMHPTHFTVFITGYTLVVAYTLFERWVWSTQLLILTSPWYMLYVGYRPCETYYLRPERTFYLSSMRPRSSDPEMLSQSMKTYVMFVYASLSSTLPIGMITVQNTTLSLLPHHRIEQCCRLSFWNRPADFLETFTLCSCEEDLIRDTRIRMGSGTYEDVRGSMELRGCTLTVWIE